MHIEKAVQGQSDCEWLGCRLCVGWWEWAEVGVGVADGLCVNRWLKRATGGGEADKRKGGMRSMECSGELLIKG